MNTATLDNPPPDRVSRRWLAFWALAVTVAYALLWSPWWYPLSDSSLYLSLARSLASGRGYTYMGAPHRMVPAATPLLLAGIYKLGGGIGAMQAVLTALMLVAHALCFLTVRRWVGERLALGATLAGAFSYWVFINAFTVMSEPLCLALFWGGMLCLTRAVGVGLGVGRRWAWVLLAALLLVGAADNRVAAMGLMPGAILALLIYAGGRRVGAGLSGRAVPTGHRVGWAAVLFLAFSSFVVGHLYAHKIVRYWNHWFPRVGTATTLSTTEPAQAESGFLSALVVEGGADTNGQYDTSKFLPGVRRSVKGFVIDLPAFGGRWLCEGLAMPSYVLFSSKNPVAAAAGTALALLVFAISIVGSVQLLRRRQWWVVGLGLYFFIFWIQWGARIKPRYMAPIAPLLFINLWTGLLTLIGWMRGRRVAGYEVVPQAVAVGGTAIDPPHRPEEPAAGVLEYAAPRVVQAARARITPDPFLHPAPLTPAGRRLAWVMLAAVIVGNAPAWGVEFYIRHLTRQPFYQVARRGAFQRLVDIAAYLQSAESAEGSVAISLGAHRRIAHWLTGRKIVDFQNDIHSWRINDEESRRSERKFRSSLSPHDVAKGRFVPPDPNIQYAIVEVDKEPVWPEFHLPLRKEWPGGTSEERWFQLYRRTGPDKFEPCDPPYSDGAFISKVPPLAR